MVEFTDTKHSDSTSTPLSYAGPYTIQNECFFQRKDDLKWFLGAIPKFMGDRRSNIFKFSLTKNEKIADVIYDQKTGTMTMEVMTDGRKSVCFSWFGGIPENPNNLPEELVRMMDD